MRSSARQHGDRYRTVLGWSLALALVIHVAVFVFSPDFVVVPPGESKAASSEFRASDVTPTTVYEVVFGPPAIRAPDGTVWQEPQDRVLRATRVTDLPMLCAHLVGNDRTPLQGAVRLLVDQDGNASVVEVEESTGDWCVDRILVRAADALRYHWLPSERFPAPVELVQPVALQAVRS